MLYTTVRFNAYRQQQKRSDTKTSPRYVQQTSNRVVTLGGNFRRMLSMEGRKPISRSWSASSKTRVSRFFTKRRNEWFSNRSMSLMMRSTRGDGESQRARLVGWLWRTSSLLSTHCTKGAGSKQTPAQLRRLVFKASPFLGKSNCTTPNVQTILALLLLPRD